MEAENGRDGGWREALEILEMIVRNLRVLFVLRLTRLGTRMIGSYWVVLLLIVGSDELLCILMEKWQTAV